MIPTRTSRSPNPPSAPVLAPSASAPVDASVVARLAGAVKRYGDVTALGGVDLEIRAGEVVALLGPNGAGKTTAISLLLGLLRPSAGRATLFGGDPAAAVNRMRSGVMMQLSGVPETLTVREHLTLQRSYYPAPLDLAAVLEQTGLAELAGRPYGQLSGGQKQRLHLALALCGDPDLLFLDEPTAGLDVRSKRALWERIGASIERGAGVLLTTHDLDEADALADRVVLLQRGRVLASGTPAELKRRAADRRVRVRTTLDEAAARALPGARRIRRDGEHLEILSAHAEATVGALLGRDPDLADLTVVDAGLEEAFLALTDPDVDPDTDRARGVADPETSFEEAPRA